MIFRHFLSPDTSRENAKSRKVSAFKKKNKIFEHGDEDELMEGYNAWNNREQQKFYSSSESSGHSSDKDHPIKNDEDRGKKHAPNWLFFMLPHEHIFGSLESLIGYLRHVDSDEDVEHHKRWFFFDQSKLQST